jgi:hypothetical protein
MRSAVDNAGAAHRRKARAARFGSFISHALVVLAGGLLIGQAHAQPNYPKYRCPDGEYRGPEAGKASYVKDEFTWFVTRDFAARSGACRRCTGTACGRHDQRHSGR